MPLGEIMGLAPNLLLVKEKVAAQRPDEVYRARTIEFSFC